MTIDGEGSPVIRTAGGNEVSVQVVQDIYNSLTGKTESIKQFHTEHFRVSISDFEHLHSKIEQTTEQYQCAGSRLTVTVRYSGGKAERFSGFERFRAQAQNRNYHTQSVEFEYDILLMLPKTREAKPYKIVVGIMSGMAALEQLKGQSINLVPLGILLSVPSVTGRMEVEYVDLAVARTFEAQISEWFDSIPKERSRLGELTKSLASSADLGVRTLSIVAAAAGLVLFYSTENLSGGRLFNAVVVCVAVISLVRVLSVRIGNRVERWLASSGSQSAISLSNADQRLIDAHGKSPLVAWAKTIVSAAASIACSILASYFARLLGF